jgi:hypothetical protein
MRVNSTVLSVIFKSMLVLIGIAGLLVVFGVFDGTFNIGVLNYFTTLSNLLCVVYFSADIVHVIKNRRAEEITTWRPALKGIAMMGVTITMLVSHFILGMGFSMGDRMGLSLLAVHYVVPILTILDWLLFDKKGQISAAAPLTWAIAPLVYFAYAMIAARIGDGIGSHSRYPYPFIDVDVLGWGKVLSTVFVLVIGFIVLGYGFYFVDRMLKPRPARGDGESAGNTP